jgi:hypothetical protein
MHTISTHFRVGKALTAMYLKAKYIYYKDLLNILSGVKTIKYVKEMPNILYTN